MRSPSSFEFDLEIKRTFCSRRKKLRIEEQIPKAQAVFSSMTGIGDDQRTLQDFIALGVQGIFLSIAQPTIEAINFELKPSVISMVQ